MGYHQSSSPINPFRVIDDCLLHLGETHSRAHRSHVSSNQDLQLYALLTYVHSPPRTWFYQNFAVLFAVALLPYLWFTTMFDVNMILWQEVYGWNSLICALRMYVHLLQHPQVPTD